jgi:hypothetical protein
LPDDSLPTQCPRTEKLILEGGTGAREPTIYAPIDYLQPGCTSLRGILRDFETAIRRGQLDGPENVHKRGRLVQAITDLAAAPGLSPRVYIRIAKIFALMSATNLSHTEPA